jgi:hypothetical protein
VRNSLGSRRSRGARQVNSAPLRSAQPGRSAGNATLIGPPALREYRGKSRVTPCSATLIEMTVPEMRRSGDAECEHRL